MVDAGLGLGLGLGRVNNCTIGFAYGFGQGGESVWVAYGKTSPGKALLHRA